MSEHTATTKSKLRWFADAMNDPEEPINWIIEPLIAEGDCVVLYGQWGSFKTQLALDWSLRMSAGLKVGTFAVPQPRRVLYVNEEMAEKKIWRRIKPLARGLDLVDTKLPLAVLSREGIKPQQSAAMQRLTAYIAEAGLHAGDVVVFDSIRRVLKGSEKDDEAVREFWDSVGVLNKGGLTTLFLHHMRKPRSKSQTTTHEASGSTDLMAGADNTIAVVRDGGNSLTVTQEKNREAEEVPPFMAHFEFGEEDGSASVEYGTGAVYTKGDPGHLETLYSYLIKHPGAAQPGIRQGTGIPRSTLSRLLKQEQRSGAIRGTPKEGYSLAPEEGI